MSTIDTTSAPSHPTEQGCVVLVPNTLDLGAGTDAAALPDIRQVLSMGVIEQAAKLRHWVVENAKSTRLFLKRVDAVCPLGVPLQAIDIQELPRPPKGGGHAAKGTHSAAHKATAAPATTPWLTLLAPIQTGHDVGVLSEAGLPGVADPGAALVQAAHGMGLRVVALPGPSSLALAVAASGLNGQSFAFVGYLPTERSERAQRLRDLEQISRRNRQTQLLIETPYRNAAMLSALIEHLCDRTWLSVSCGLTLPGGFTRTATVAAWRSRTTESPPLLPDNVPAVFAFLAA